MLGRLLEQLRSQGLLDNTDVIIASDHGEAFGAHSIMGHGYSVNLDEVGVPLVILSPKAPAGKEVNAAVSLRDLPATVVDLLGLSADSPLPGHSLATYWSQSSDQTLEEQTSPAFSERVDAAAFKTHPEGRPGSPGFEMSLVAMGHHYIRDSQGTERLFNLYDDPYERRDLIHTSEGRNRVEVCRSMLLKVLSESPGSVEVEHAYLSHYRNELKTDLGQSSLHQVASGH